MLIKVWLQKICRYSSDIRPAPVNTHGILGVMDFTVNFCYLPTADEVAALHTEIEKE